MRMILVCAAVLAFGSGARADEDFLRRWAATRGFMLGRPKNPMPTRDGKVLFLRSGPRSRELSLFEYDVATRATREWLTAAKLLGGAEETMTAAEHARRERMRQTMRGLTSFELSEDESQLLVPLSGQLFLVKRKDGAVTHLKTGPGVIDAHLSPDGTKVSYARDTDLYVYDVRRGRELRLTRSGDPKITNGVAEFAAQEELDRHRGNWWSPDSKRILFEEADSRELPNFYISDAAHPEKDPDVTPYPRAGGPNAKLRLGIVPAT